MGRLSSPCLPQMIALRALSMPVVLPSFKPSLSYPKIRRSSPVSVTAVSLSTSVSRLWKQVYPSKPAAIKDDMTTLYNCDGMMRFGGANDDCTRDSCRILWPSCCCQSATTCSPEHCMNRPSTWRSETEFSRASWRARPLTRLTTTGFSKGQISRRLDFTS